MTKIDETLAARDTRYGTFMDNARCSQLIKSAFRSGANWNKLGNDQKEALEQIASKIGRMLTGDFNYVDSWHDITGYAKLVENRLLSASGWAPSKPTIEPGDKITIAESAAITQQRANKQDAAAKKRQESY
jgi:hypothetical protein